MGELRPQNLANHTRLDPPFHFFLLPLSAIWFLGEAWIAIRHPSFDSFWLALGAFLFVVAVIRIRVYSLKVQDRVIRMEERLRLAALVPDSDGGERQALVSGLTESQLIALRFASDAEMPGLAARAVKERLAASDIKKAIRTWRADYFRI